jgi:LPS sulfotransferase NodH
VTALPAPTWVYVASSRRSGSTLLGVLIAQASGGFNVGEMWQLWRRLEEAKPCQCGLAVGDCPVWSRVVAGVRSRLGAATDDAVARYDRHLHYRSPIARLSTRVDANDIALRAATEAALEDVVGASVYVDVSKKPVFLESAVRRPRPVVVVHLVRDPRGVTYSNLRAKPMPAADAVFPRIPAWHGSGRWSRDNLQIEYTLARLARRFPSATVLRVAYEELASSPEQVVARVTEAVGSVPRSSAATSGHGIAGNAALYQPAPVTLDRRWERGMSRRDQMTVLALTAPLLRRYGYVARPARDDDDVPA